MSCPETPELSCAASSSACVEATWETPANGEADCYEVTVNCPTSSPTFVPTATPVVDPTPSPTGPTPGAVGRIFTEITTATTSRTIFWIVPYSGSEAAFITSYIICVRVSGSDSSTNVCDYNAPVVEADGGATHTYDVEAVYFGLVSDTDYTVEVAATNNYGMTGAFTTGIFSTETIGRRLSSFSNSTNFRQLSQSRTISIHRCHAQRLFVWFCSWTVLQCSGSSMLLSCI
jgi:hypothetical protein